VGLTLGSRHRTGGHMTHALARLRASQFRDRSRMIASQADAMDGLELAAEWVEGLAVNPEVGT
jgi:hypothetical protein